ncbi:MAG: glycosyl transferase [Solirubrobacterales bacterium]|nr:glycosyl transferase [Solirubrobacterales bacterium]
MRVIAVLPAFNEQGSVGDVVRGLVGEGIPACVIDDGSSDATARRAREAGATVLSLPINLGVGGALRCGFRWAVEAGYDVAVQVDADGQHDPSEVRLLVDGLLAQDADMAVGSRFVAGSGAYPVSRGRRLGMRVLERRAAAATGTRIIDATSGFRAIRRPLLERFADDYPVEYLGDTVEALILAGQFGATVVEIPVRMAERQHGEPSAGFLGSVWYVARVMLAIELMHRRRARTVALRDAEPMT